MDGIIARDHLAGNPLDRIDELERRAADLERQLATVTKWLLATENLTLEDAGSSGASAQDWIEVTVGGTTGYIRVYATK